MTQKISSGNVSAHQGSIVDEHSTVESKKPASAHVLSVGQRLKYVRERAGLSQRELARRAAMTNGTLSNIEQDRVSPSIASLEKILSAVPIALQEFFADDFAASSSIYRVGQFVEIHKDNTHYRILPLDNASQGTYLAAQTYAPGAQVHSEWMVRNGTIAGIIMEGTLDLTLDGIKYCLDVGEGFSFSIHRAHTFKNVSAKPCTVVGVSLAV